MDLNIFKTVTETIDWLQGKYKNVSDHKVKEELNEIANKIVTLTVNKAAYLSSLKRSIKSGNEEVDLFEINSAILIAEKDTSELSNLLEKANLSSPKISFELKHGLSRLTKLKQIKLLELKDIIAKDVVDSTDQSQIIDELERFEEQWLDLGNKIDEIIRQNG